MFMRMLHAGNTVGEIIVGHNRGSFFYVLLFVRNMRKQANFTWLDNLYVITKYVQIYLSKFLCDDFTPNIITSLVYMYTKGSTFFIYRRMEGGGSLIQFPLKRLHISSKYIVEKGEYCTENYVLARKEGGIHFFLTPPG